jgi:hypothetical protein
LPGRVIVFTNQNIYIEGVISRLRQYNKNDKILFIDSKDNNFYPMIEEHNPSLIIIDASETDDDECCLLCGLLELVKNCTIIRLNVQAKDVQVVKSSSHILETAQDLINLISTEC